MKVGFTLPQAAIDGDGGSWAGIRQLALLADERGADSVWVCDHFLDRTLEREVGYHEPMTLLAAIAAVTSRIELGTLVASTSFRSPGLLAKLAATLDDVAGGRVRPPRDHVELHDRARRRPPLPGLRHPLIDPPVRALQSVRHQVNVSWVR